MVLRGDIKSKVALITIFLLIFNIFIQEKVYGIVVDKTLNQIITPSENIQKITVNKDYNLANTSSSNNESSYKFEFELHSSGYIDLQWKETNEIKQEIDYIILELLDDTGNVIKKINTSDDMAEDSGLFQYRVGLWYGKYTINMRVMKYNNDNITTLFKINYVVADDYEKDSDYANNIRLNKTYRGMSIVSNDNSSFIDRYKFSTKFTEDITINIKYTNPEDYFNYDWIYIYDSNDNYLDTLVTYEFDSKGDGLYSNTIIKLPAGTYYLRLEISRYKVPYEIMVEGNDSSSLDYYVVNNESVNIQKTESSGTLASNSIFNNYIQNNYENSLERRPYKIDINFEYNPEVTKGELVSSQNLISTQYVVGDNRKFWVTRITDSSDYEITARLNYSGSKCNVWVDVNNNLSVEDAVKLGKEFDNKIYSLVTQNFAMPSDVNNDGKINILCYDIEDGFNGSGGYVAGYFYARDLYNETNSNNCEIFYIDTYPTISYDDNVDLTIANSTLAHEFQHMVNFNQNVLVEGVYDSTSKWLNEALSMAAEHMYFDAPLLNRINYYNYSSSIKNGRSILYWNNYNEIMANYSLSYLFGQYVRVQAGQGNKVFKEILLNNNNSYKAVEDVVKKYVDNNMSFEEFTSYFRMALAAKNKTGLLGFKGEAEFDMLNLRTFTDSRVDLLGTASIIVPVQEIPKDKGENIAYKKVSLPANIRNIDVNNDEKIDINDLAKVAVNYNNIIENKEWNEYSDINIDYIVDMYDLVYIANSL